jgi:hypothetical protein
MKNHFLIFIICFFVFSCQESSTKLKELELKEKELSLKERELNLRDQESVSKESKTQNTSQSVKPDLSEINYTLIKKSDQIPGKINSSDISKLSEPLLALAAFYSGLGGSNCYGETCDLTTALGLGNQGSSEHKNLISKWLPGDKAAKQLLAQDCYQRPSGASSFSDYEFLLLKQIGDTVIVNYNLMYWNRGNVVNIKGPDKYLIDGNHLQTLNRNIWKEF